MTRVTVARPVRRFADGTFVSAPDTVAGEEPLELRVAGERLTLTMRTPGHDVELAHGYLFAEGVIAAASDVRTVRYCDGVDEQGRNTYNVLDVTLAADRTSELDGLVAAATRTGVTIVGVRGVRVRVYRRSAGPHALPAGARPSAARLRPSWRRCRPGCASGQRIFRRTGRAARRCPGRPRRRARARSGRTSGRHNAVDKVIGAALLAGELPGTDRILLTSSRASFELVQKAAMAGIPVLVAVSAPSSLAVDLATDAGMTLIGFARDGAFNLYTGAERVAGA